MQRLYAPCVRIKSQISAGFAEAVRGTMTIPAQQTCERVGCSCAACDGRTLDSHRLYRFNLAGAVRREIHFHPRCHDLWLEAVTGVKSGPEAAGLFGKPPKHHLIRRRATTSAESATLTSHQQPGGKSIVRPHRLIPVRAACDTAFGFGTGLRRSRRQCCGHPR